VNDSFDDNTRREAQNRAVGEGADDAAAAAGAVVGPVAQGSLDHVIPSNSGNQGLQCGGGRGRNNMSGPNTKCSLRHVIPFNSSNEGLQCGGRRGTNNMSGPDTQCSPRHVIHVNSSNEGLHCGGGRGRNDMSGSAQWRRGWSGAAER